MSNPPPHTQLNLHFSVEKVQRGPFFSTLFGHKLKTPLVFFARLIYDRTDSVIRDRVEYLMRLLRLSDDCHVYLDDFPVSVTAV